MQKLRTSGSAPEKINGLVKVHKIDNTLRPVVSMSETYFIPHRVNSFILQKKIVRKTATAAISVKTFEDITDGNTFVV